MEILLQQVPYRIYVFADFQTTTQDLNIILYLFSALFLIYLKIPFVLHTEFVIFIIFILTL